ncbi:stealth conserved region 3 domain-containing protein [Microbacterium profundi]|uniref:Stealth conserved region 3 domain-containing protein n=1 Tax=Microbacterium profundi TaxID=450380 RepID=A0ABV3LKH3_9MICO
MTTLTSVPAQPNPTDEALGRSDVRLEQGVLHLVHDSLSPEQARTEDLLLIARTLEEAGIDVLLVRHGIRTPALAVDLVHEEKAIAALQAICDREPFYVKPRGMSVVPLAELVLHLDGPASLRLFRPRIAGELRYGVSSGVRVEFWRFGHLTIEAPLANALMRRVMAADEASYTAVTRYGRAWRTVVGMFDTHPGEFTPEVDMVFSWVDGSSSDFQRQRAARMAEYVVGEGDDGSARYRHVNELRYALRSVHMYAPWVRRIFIATDSPRPDWLADHPQVTIVRSEDFFADRTALPTHNSHAVEAQLHRIEGLAEHFLYSNDDMFFARPIEPELFFSPAGLTKFVEAEIRIGTGPSTAQRSGHDNALRVNRALLQERFGRTIVRDLEHCATPLRRSVIEEMEREFPTDFRRTATSRFRSATDISVTNCLYHYYALFTGRAIATTEPRTRYYQTTQAKPLRRAARLRQGRDVDMFCLNDGGESEAVPEDMRVQMITELLERLYPVRAPWEQTDVPPESAKRPRKRAVARR